MDTNYTDGTGDSPPTTMNHLTEEERTHLFCFAKSFIQSIEDKSNKVPSKSFTESLVGSTAGTIGAVGIVAALGAVPFLGSAAMALSQAGLTAKIFTKLFGTVTSKGVDKSQKDQRDRNYEEIKIKIKQVIVKNELSQGAGQSLGQGESGKNLNNNKQRLIKTTFRLFFAHMATDIFLRFKDIIYIWCSQYDPYYDFIDEIGRFAGGLFFDHLKKAGDKNEALQKFVGKQNLNIKFEKNSKDKDKDKDKDTIAKDAKEGNSTKPPNKSRGCGCFPAKDPFQSYKGIFFQSVPAFYIEEEGVVKVKVGISEKDKVKDKDKSKDKEKTKDKEKSKDKEKDTPTEKDSDTENKKDLETTKENLASSKNDPAQKSAPIIEFDSKFKKSIRPPFEFEQNDIFWDLLDLEKCNFKMEIIQTKSPASHYVWEDCTALTIELFEQLEVDEDLNGLNALYDKISKLVQKKTEEINSNLQNTNNSGKKQESKKVPLSSDTPVDFGKIISGADLHVPYFVGRDTMLKEIHKTICETQNDLLKFKLEDKIVILHGSDGQGKTQLLRKYAKDYWMHHRNIIWIDAGNFDSLKNSFEDVIIQWEIQISDSDKNYIESETAEERGKISKLAQCVYKYFAEMLEEVSTKCLFIFDNVQELEKHEKIEGQKYSSDLFSIGPFLPLLKQEINESDSSQQMQQQKLQELKYLPSFLIISQNQNLVTDNKSKDYPKFLLQPLLPNETNIFLKQFFELPPNLNLESKENSALKLAMDNIGNELKGFPLGIAIAAANIKANVEEEIQVAADDQKINAKQSLANKISKIENEISNFITKCCGGEVLSKKQFAKVRDSFAENNAEQNENLVKKILEVTIETIRGKNDENGKKALKVLHLMGYLATDNISTEVCYSIYYNTPLHSRKKALELENEYSRDEFNALLKILTKFNLIYTETKLNNNWNSDCMVFKTKINIHSLVQKIIREIFKEDISNLGKLLRANVMTEKGKSLDTCNFNSCVDSLLTASSSCTSPNDMSIQLTACLISAQISTHDPFEIDSKILKKIRDIYQNINHQMEMKDQIAILDMTLKLWEVMGSDAFHVHNVERLITKFVGVMTDSQSEIFIQFVGSISLRYLLCDYPMHSLISCEIYKNVQEWSLQFLRNLWTKTVQLQGIWILVYENIFKIYTNSEMLFLTGDSTEAVKLLTKNFTLELDVGCNGYWSALYSTLYGCKNLQGFNCDKIVKDAEYTFIENNGIDIIADKLVILKKNYFQSQEQNRIVAGIIIQLSQKVDYATKFEYSNKFMTALRSCIVAFSETAGIGSKEALVTTQIHDSKTPLKLSTMVFTLISIVSMSPLENSIQHLTVQNIAKLEETSLCFSNNCQYCENHSNEYVRSLLNTFLRLNNNENSREVKAARDILKERRPAAENSSGVGPGSDKCKYNSKYRLLSPNRDGILSLSNKEKDKDKEKKEKLRVEEAYQELTHLITGILKFPCGNVADSSADRETKQQDAEKDKDKEKKTTFTLTLDTILTDHNFGDWPPSKLTYLIAMATAVILKRNECHPTTNNNNCEFSYKVLCSIKWFHFKNQNNGGGNGGSSGMGLKPVDDFLLQLGLQFHLIYNYYKHNHIVVHRGGSNFITWTLDKMDNFMKDRDGAGGGGGCGEVKSLALCLGSLAIFEGQRSAFLQKQNSSDELTVN